MHFLFLGSSQRFTVIQMRDINIIIHSHEGCAGVGRKKWGNPPSRFSSSHARSGRSATFQGSKGSGRIDISESCVNRERVHRTHRGIPSKRGGGNWGDSRARKSFLAGPSSDLRREVVDFKGPALRLRLFDPTKRPWNGRTLQRDFGVARGAGLAVVRAFAPWRRA